MFSSNGDADMCCGGISASTSKNVSSVLSLYDYHNVFIHNKKVNINIFFLFIEAGMSSNGFYSLS